MQKLKKKMNSKTKQKAIVLIVRDKLLATTAHGIANVISTENMLVKLMWLISIAISTLACAYFNRNTVLDYFSFDVVTQIDIIHETSALFPTISFCSAYPFQVPRDLVVCTIKNENCFNKTNYLIAFNDTHYKYCYRFNSGISNSFIYSSFPGPEYVFDIYRQSLFILI